MSTDSKTSQAVAYFLDNQETGVTVYAAAKQFDIDPTAIYKRLKLLAYCAAAPAEANEFAGLAANFFFAVSTQAAKS